MATAIHVPLSDVKSTCTIKRPTEIINNLEIDQADVANFRVITTKNCNKWEVLGIFEPISVFQLKDPEYADYSTQIWAHLYSSLETDNVKVAYENGNQSKMKEIMEISSMVNFMFPRPTTFATDELSPVDEEDLEKKMKSNSFKLKDKKSALYNLPSFINHSCVPNCIQLFGDQDELILIAIEDISVGQEITISYSQDPKEHLNVYGFQCSCEGCLGLVEKKLYHQHLFKETACGKCQQEGSKYKCTRCGVVHYCSATCQKAHWPTHKHFCKYSQQVVKK